MKKNILYKILIGIGVFLLFSIIVLAIMITETIKKEKAPETNVENVLSIGGRVYVVDTVVLYKDFKGNGLYNKHCKQCHDETGAGKGVIARHNPEICPADLTKLIAPDDTIHFAISYGRKKMPGQKDELTDQEIWILVDKTKTFKTK